MIIDLDFKKAYALPDTFEYYIYDDNVVGSHVAIAIAIQNAMSLDYKLRDIKSIEYEPVSVFKDKRLCFIGCCLNKDKFNQVIDISDKVVVIDSNEDNYYQLSSIESVNYIYVYKRNYSVTQLTWGYFNDSNKPTLLTVIDNHLQGDGNLCDTLSKLSKDGFYNLTHADLCEYLAASNQ